MNAIYVKCVQQVWYNSHMEDEFEIFDNNTVGRVVDSITVTKNYQINFPSAFYRKHNLFDKKYVLLYFNKKKKMVAIEFLNNYDPRGFKISKSNKGKNGGYITAKKFFVAAEFVNKIEFHRYKYEYKKITKNGCEREFFVILLEGKKPTVVTVR